MKNIFVVCILSAHLLLIGQTTEERIKELKFNEFFQLVLSNNIDFIIEKYEVSIAEAAVKAARVFENPEIEMMFPMFNNDDFSDFPANIAFEMDIPIELFGKRKNRIRMAKAEKFAAVAELEDFLRYLKADAANVFVEILFNQRVTERMHLTLEQLAQLIEINEALLNAGEIGEIDLIKTRLEARNFEAELFDIRAEYFELMSELYYLIGGIPEDSIILIGEVNITPPLIEYNALKQKALSERTDIILALRNIDIANQSLKLARSERLPDIALKAGYHNEDALKPMPGIKTAYAGITIPLKFSGFNKGNYLENYYGLKQQQAVYELMLLSVETEIQTSWHKFQLLSQKRTLFTETILTDAERVRDAVIYSYQRGEVSLLEVLEAQRTLNEIYMNYYETLSQYSQSLIELSFASGNWLVEF